MDNDLKQPATTRQLNLWSLAFELGYTIAVPIVVLALAGRFADKYFDTSPWLLLLGIPLSIAISTAIVYKKVKKII